MSATNNDDDDDDDNNNNNNVIFYIRDTYTVLCVAISIEKVEHYRTS